MDVLIIEDDENAAKAIRRVIMNAGFSVEIAENGCKALEMLKTQVPRLVISDLMMPFMNGIEVLGRIKADERLRGVKVMILSAVAQAKLEEALDAGADLVLAKPFGNAELTAKIKEILGIS